MSLPPRPSLAHVLPELEGWEGANLTAEDRLTLFGSMAHALIYSALFWPTFVEHRGCLLREGFSLDLFDDWMRVTKGNRTAVEAVMNHRHLTQLFPNADAQPTPEQITSLGHLLRDVWELKLVHDFPHLEIEVRFQWEDQAFDDDAELLVYCRR